MTVQEYQMFGVSIDDIKRNYIESFMAKLSGQEMVIITILSDCQERLSLENVNKEQIRKQLNIAKHILYVHGLKN